MPALNSRPARTHSMFAVAAVLALAASCLIAFSVSPAFAATSTGGASPSSATQSVPPIGPPGKARIASDGHTAVAPADAPPLVKRAIAYANKITSRPYVYGGGHRSFTSSGYDCSGAVSYMLRGAKLLDSPLFSGLFMKWGETGTGQWITVYANAGHAYATVAGLRWDTSGPGESGPRWRQTKRSNAGYAVRHPDGF